jgi:uncharacterized protein YdhG (YjbR/CyaY superfamily)
MQSTATTVDAYLAEAPAERREVLSAIRNLCRQNFPGCVEAMTYGMPTYTCDDGSGVAFASQKQYISIYVDPRVLEAHRAELRGASCGKSCLRYSRPEKVDLDLVATLLRESVSACP